MSRTMRSCALGVGLCLLMLPRNDWPPLHELAWGASVWLDAVRSERTELPTEARAALMREQRLQGVAGQQALQDWQRRAELSLQRSLPVALPYAETFVLGGDEHAYSDLAVQTFTISLPTPERLRIRTRAAEGARGGVIVDVFEADAPGTGAGALAGAGDDDRAAGPLLLGSFGPQPLEQRVVLLPDSHGRTPAGARQPSMPAPEPHRTLHVRVQPTPAALGRFAVLLDAQPAFGFPVDTDAASPVRSRFGVARDGGRRSHHGIDIFASRGTAVLAATDGVVVRTGESPRGGLHVWQRGVDERGERIGSLYYAHLERIDVQPGSVVRRGEQLGTVGNTGNARTTPPHLHFGLYRRFAGPVDPLPLTGEARRAAPEIVLEAALPRWLHVVPPRANLRSSPDTTRAPLTTLASGELVRVDGILPGGRWLRVSVAGASAGVAGQVSSGWITRSLLGPPRPGEPIAARGAFRAHPAIDAPVLAELQAGTAVTPFGRFGNALRVRTSEGLVGWLSVEDANS